MRDNKASQGMDRHIRLALSAGEGDVIEIYSCETDTVLMLPLVDKDMLIAGLQNWNRTESSPEIICLDPTS
jgi:hypothetical protein